MTLNTPVTLFEKDRERYDHDTRIEVWEGTGYVMVKRIYLNGARYFDVIPDREVSRYLPYIYIHTDDEGRPTGVSIQTTSYGSLNRESYKELMRAMALAEAHAEDIEVHHLQI